MATPELVGQYVGRPQSPNVEVYMQGQIVSALNDLLSTRGLYQKTAVDFAGLAKFRDAQRPPNRAEETAVSLQKEFLHRPWIPVSKHLGDSKAMAEITRVARIGGQPSGTAVSDLVLQFHLPAFQSLCPVCDKETTHASLAGSRDEAGDTGFPKLDSKGRHQLWSLFYRCELCHEFTAAIMVKRVGFQLLLCGRSERQPPPVPPSIPKDLVPIVEDAISSENEGDLFGGIYHLRTFLEHYMKSCASVPIPDQINGDELSDKYKSTIDPRMLTGFPVLGVIYTALSASLHARTGTRTEFAKALREIDAHLKAKKMFEEFKA